jgi:hypothetical protein
MKKIFFLGMLSIMIHLLGSRSQAQQALEDFDCVSNRNVKFELRIAETRKLIQGTYFPTKYYVQLLDTVCVDSLILDDLQFMLDNFANTKYDWGFNWVFYAYFREDPLHIRFLKPGKWRRKNKSQDFDFFEEKIAKARLEGGGQ